MTLRGNIDLSGPESAVVPRAALMQDEEGTYVFTVAEGVAHKTPVSLLTETDTEAAVKEAFAAGTQVVVAGNAALKDGMKVRLPAEKSGAE